MLCFQKTVLCLVAFVFCCCPVMACTPVQDPTVSLIDDDFSSEAHGLRDAARGDWKIEGGMASVVQDEEMYKKFKKHGPIMIYKVEHDDATALMEFKPMDCKTVVFTMDAAEGGHALRVKMRVHPQGEGNPSKKEAARGKSGPTTQIITYAAKIGDAKAEQILLSEELPKLVAGEWNQLEVTVKGENATIKMGETTVRVSHPRIDQKKGVAKIGFSFGSFDIRKFQLSQ